MTYWKCELGLYGPSDAGLEISWLPSGNYTWEKRVLGYSEWSWKVPHKPEMDNLCRPTKSFAFYSWLAEAVRLDFYFEG